MFKFCIGLAVFGAVCAVQEQVADGNESSQLFNETPCLTYGGICVVAADCPDGQLTRSGLCPVQQKRGVECCYSMSKTEKKCSRGGGDCMSNTFKCPDELTDKEATDCRANETCCILVK